MYVTMHAWARMAERLGVQGDMNAGDVSATLERVTGEPGHVAYIVLDLPHIVTADGSNGDVLVAVAIDGSVETIYFRRSDQDFSAEWFGVSKVVDLRPDDREEPEWDPNYRQSPEYLAAYEQSKADDRALTRAERREARRDNSRKMVVTNRSAVMLGRLIREQKQRRRVGRRKAGGK